MENHRSLPSLNHFVRGPNDPWVIAEPKTVTKVEDGPCPLIVGLNDDATVRYDSVQPHIRPDINEINLQEFHSIFSDWEYVPSRHDHVFASNLVRRYVQLQPTEHAHSVYHSIVRRIKRIFVGMDVAFHGIMVKNHGTRLSMISLRREWCQLKCDVCSHSTGTLASVLNVGGRPLLDSDLLLCSRCDLIIHSHCYRRFTPSSAGLTARFVCDQCKRGQKLSRCTICHNYGGFMVPGSGQQRDVQAMVHPVCSAVSNDGAENVVCLICYKHGGLCIRCASPTDCHRWFHPRCAQLSFSNRPQGKVTFFEMRPAPNCNGRVTIICDEHHPKCVQRMNIFQPGLFAFALHQSRLRLLDVCHNTKMMTESDYMNRCILSFWRQKKIGVRCDQIIWKRILESGEQSRQDASNANVGKCVAVVDIFSRKKPNIQRHPAALPPSTPQIARIFNNQPLPKVPKAPPPPTTITTTPSFSPPTRGPTIRLDSRDRPKADPVRWAHLQEAKRILELMLLRENLEMRRISLLGLRLDEQFRSIWTKQSGFAERGMRLRSACVVGEITRMFSDSVSFDGLNEAIADYRECQQEKKSNGIVDGVRYKTSKITNEECLVQQRDPSTLFNVDDLEKMRNIGREFEVGDKDDELVRYEFRY